MPDTPPQIPQRYLYQDRFDTLRWPATIHTAAAAWGVSVQAAAKVLSRMTKAGLTERRERSEYWPAPPSDLA